MFSYIASRFFRALVTVFLVMTFAFVVLRMSGDPAQIMLGPDAPQESIDAFRKAWGWMTRYGFNISLISRAY